jgi:hypothetical protein
MDLDPHALTQGLSSPATLAYAGPDPAAEEQRRQAGMATQGLIDWSLDFLAHGGELVVSGVGAGLEVAGEAIGGLLDGIG